MSNTTDLLSKLFNDPKTGFVGADKLSITKSKAIQSKDYSNPSKGLLGT